MKKILIVIIASLSALVFTQCQSTIDKVDNGENSGDKPAKMVQITFSAAPATAKTAIQDTGSGDPLFTWVEGDVIYVYDGTKCCGVLEMASYSSPGSEEASFIGSIQEPSGSDITFFHFGSKLTAPTSSAMELDCFNQDATIDWVQSHFIASCTMPYNGEHYKGELKSAFAVGCFEFENGSYEVGKTVSVRGMAQKVSVNEKGEITYTKGTTADFTQFSFTSASKFYLALPATTDNNKVLFLNEETGKYKKFDTAIENEFFYRANVELEDIECKIYYKADIGNGSGYTDFSESPYTEKNKISHEIIKPEPRWRGTSIGRTFLGWSEKQDDTEGPYTSPYQEEGLHSIDIVGRDEITFYAIFKDITEEKPYVDFEAYELVNASYFDYLFGWEFKKYIKFTAKTNSGYDKISFPIRNLTKDTWYELKFKEELQGEKDKNMFHGLGVYATAVQSAVATQTTYNSVLTYAAGDAKNVGANEYVWVHSLGKYDTQEYTPTESAHILFKAEAPVMYWVWDMSKHNNHNTIYNIYSTILPTFDVIEAVPEGTPCVDFRNATFHGFRTSAFGSEPQDEDDAGHKAGQGYSTYKSYAEDNKFMDFTTICLKGSYEKINIPLTHLNPETTYVLKFKYERQSEKEIPGEELHGAGYNFKFCYYVQQNKNTTTDKEKLPSEYTDFKGRSKEDGEIVFTASASTMYWVWSMADLKNYYWNTHKITITEFKAVE